MNYTQIQIENIWNEKFHYLKVNEIDHVLQITLARPQKKNAMNPQMMNEIAFALNYAHYTKEIWMVMIQAEGDVFCAGADLKAFLGEIEPHESSIPEPDGEVLLGNIFHTIHKPCIAKIQGNVYAGGFFFLAGCHFVYAENEVQLALTEVKRGLYPFQVMLALMEFMPKRVVLDWCLRGYSMSVSDAQKYQLITEICSKEDIDEKVNDLIEELKGNSPSAMRLGLKAYDSTRGNLASLQQELKKMLKETTATLDAKEGITAFKEKRKPLWKGE